MGEIANNIAEIRARISEAAQKIGKSGKDIILVAATKMNDSARVREAIAAGVDVCGENRVQELLEKYEEGAYVGAPLHFIGTLQTNKVKYIVGKVVGNFNCNGSCKNNTITNMTTVATENIGQIEAGYVVE